jgi:hypothetical protein
MDSLPPSRETVTQARNVKGMIRGRETTLADYIRRIELFGTECVMQVAAKHLSEGDVGALKAHIAFWERNYTWRGEWVAKRQASARSCRGCDLDIPRSRGSRARFHSDGCATRARKARQRSGIAQTTSSAGGGAQTVTAPAQQATEKGYGAKTARAAALVMA